VEGLVRTLVSIPQEGGGIGEHYMIGFCASGESGGGRDVAPKTKQKKKNKKKFHRSDFVCVYCFYFGNVALSSEVKLG